jgi:branched-chain amino acid transport system substrate-binding protein
MLSQAIKDAKSSEPKAVARALEGVKFTSLNGPVEMRKSDHQLQQSLIITSWTKANGAEVKYDLEKTGYGFKTIEKVDSAASSLPTTCQMKRPG